MSRQRVWVRTDLVQQLLSDQDVIANKENNRSRKNSPYGKSNNGFSSHSSTADSSSDESLDRAVPEWEWILGTLLPDESEIASILIEDEERPEYDGKTVSVPPHLQTPSDILTVNTWYADFRDGKDSEESVPPSDMIHLTHLHEPAVVHCLESRYETDNIYTSTGPILLAVNPFKSCGGLYSDRCMKQYWDRGCAKSDGKEEKESLPPHVFGCADHAFRSMMKGREGTGSRNSRISADQSILVSGESGSGKTVTTKHIMKYLASVSERMTDPKSDHEAKVSSTRKRRVSGVRNLDQETNNIEKKVLQSNPILESFGNARTIRNDNSSRFGKFIELQFNTAKGSLIGASVHTYLLEKVRLISQSPGERNYHIFYEVLSGFSEEERSRYFLQNCDTDDFRMTSVSKTRERRDGVEDGETFDSLLDALSTMGFSEGEEKNLFSTICAVLHASNISFSALSDDECIILPENNPNLDAVLSLLGVEYGAFNDAMCSFTIHVGKESTKRALSKSRAAKGLDAFIKGAYGALFTHIVDRVNALITGDVSAGRNGTPAKKESKAYIGVLDIFGFESFVDNSLEQLCINYCNEALQQQFNLFVFKNEQAEYEREGIQWSFIDFPDNQDVLDLIDAKGAGIIPILDDMCKAPRTNDRIFAHRIFASCKDHPRFHADHRQVANLRFEILHYAGAVEYNTRGFIEKNKDDLPREASDLLCSSSHPFVRKLAEGLAVNSTHKRASSVGDQFASQLRELRERIRLTAPHYVRCLKPNDELIPDYFHKGMIGDQLRCAGVLEAIRVSRVGYPQRLGLAAFVHRYGPLAPEDVANRKGHKQRCAALVQTLAAKMDGQLSKDTTAAIQMGKSKVFLRSHAFQFLERLKETRMEKASVTIQTNIRGCLARDVFHTALDSVVLLQTFARRCLARNAVQELRRRVSAIRIQSAVRKFEAIRRYRGVTIVARYLQRVHRGNTGRALHAAQNRQSKSVLLQKCWRRYHWSTVHKNRKRSAMVLQRFSRCRAARATLKSLKMGARDLEAIKSERDELREEVGAMTRLLDETLEEMRAEAHKFAVTCTQLEEENARLRLDLDTSNRVSVEQTVCGANDTDVNLCTDEEKKITEEMLPAQASVSSQEERASFHLAANQPAMHMDGSEHAIMQQNNSSQAMEDSEHLAQELEMARADILRLEECHRQTIEDHQHLITELDTKKEEISRLQDTNEAAEDSQGLMDELTVAKEEIQKLKDLNDTTADSTHLINELAMARLEIEKLKDQNESTGDYQYLIDELAIAKGEIERLSDLNEISDNSQHPVNKLTVEELEIERSRDQNRNIQIALNTRITPHHETSDGHHNSTSSPTKSESYDHLFELQDSDHPKQPPSHYHHTYDPSMPLHIIPEHLDSRDIVSCSTLTESPDEVFRLKHQVESLARRIDDSSSNSIQMAEDVRHILRDNRELKAEITQLKSEVKVQKDALTTDLSHVPPASSKNRDHARSRRGVKSPKMNCSMAPFVKLLLQNSALSQPKASGSGYY